MFLQWFVLVVGTISFASFKSSQIACTNQVSYISSAFVDAWWQRRYGLLERQMTYWVPPQIKDSKDLSSSRASPCAAFLSWGMSGVLSLLLRAAATVSRTMPGKKRWIVLNEKVVCCACKSILTCSGSWPWIHRYAKQISAGMGGFATLRVPAFAVPSHQLWQMF